MGRASVAALLAAGTLFAGCGVDTPKVPTFAMPKGGSGSSSSPHGDTATFSIGGQVISVTQSGTAQVSTAAPQLDHDGPLGCEGRYFTGHLTEHVGLLFSYTRRGAYLLIGTSQLYHLPKPTQREGALVFARDFPDRGRIEVAVVCGR
jgi:hypothetical protein